MKLKKRSVAGLILTLAPLAAAAQPMSLELTAGNMLAQTHSHALIMGVTGTFRKLSGRLDFDPTAKTCHIDVTFVVKSLELPNALVRSESMSKTFLDPEEYPTQHYTANCVAADRLQGELTMRGQTHPFDMQVTYITTNGQVTAIHAEGVLNSDQWGMNGQMIVGKMIRVTNDISLNGQPPRPAS